MNRFLILIVSCPCSLPTYSTNILETKLDVEVEDVKIFFWTFNNNCSPDQKATFMRCLKIPKNVFHSDSKHWDFFSPFFPHSIVCSILEYYKLNYVSLVCTGTEIEEWTNESVFEGLVWYCSCRLMDCILFLQAGHCITWAMFIMPRVKPLAK